MLDIYHITGITSFLCSYLKKVSAILKKMLFMSILQLINLVERSEMDEQKTEKLSFFLEEVSAQMKGLESMMVASVNKKRVANMMRTCQVILIQL